MMAGMTWFLFLFPLAIVWQISIAEDLRMVCMVSEHQLLSTDDILLNDICTDVLLKKPSGLSGPNEFKDFDPILSFRRRNPGIRLFISIPSSYLELVPSPGSSKKFSSGIDTIVKYLKQVNAQGLDVIIGNTSPGFSEALDFLRIILHFNELKLTITVLDSVSNQRSRYYSNYFGAVDFIHWIPSRFIAMGMTDWEQNMIYDSSNITEDFLLNQEPLEKIAFGLPSTVFLYPEEPRSSPRSYYDNYESDRADATANILTRSQLCSGVELKTWQPKITVRDQLLWSQPANGQKWKFAMQFGRAIVDQINAVRRLGGAGFVLFDLPYSQEVNPICKKQKSLFLRSIQLATSKLTQHRPVWARDDPDSAEESDEHEDDEAFSSPVFSRHQTSEHRFSNRGEDYEDSEEEGSSESKEDKDDDETIRRVLKFSSTAKRNGGNKMRGGSFQHSNSRRLARRKDRKSRNEDEKSSDPLMKSNPRKRSNKNSKKDLSSDKKVDRQTQGSSERNGFPGESVPSENLNVRRNNGNDRKIKRRKTRSIPGSQSIPFEEQYEFDYIDYSEDEERNYTAYSSEKENDQTSEQEDSEDDEREDVFFEPETDVNPFARRLAFRDSVGDSDRQGRAKLLGRPANRVFDQPMNHKDVGSENQRGNKHRGDIKVNSKRVRSSESPNGRTMGNRKKSGRHADRTIHLFSEKSESEEMESGEIGNQKSSLSRNDRKMAHRKRPGHQSGRELHRSDEETGSGELESDEMGIPKLRNHHPRVLHFAGNMTFFIWSHDREYEEFKNYFQIVNDDDLLNGPVYQLNLIYDSEGNIDNQHHSMFTKLIAGQNLQRIFSDLYQQFTESGNPIPSLLIFTDTINKFPVPILIEWKPQETPDSHEMGLGAGSKWIKTKSPMIDNSSELPAIPPNALPQLPPKLRFRFNSSGSAIKLPHAGHTGNRRPTMIAVTTPSTETSSLALVEVVTDVPTADNLVPVSIAPTMSAPIEQPAIEERLLRATFIQRDPVISVPEIEVARSTNPSTAVPIVVAQRDIATVQPESLSVVDATKISLPLEDGANPSAPVPPKSSASPEVSGGRQQRMTTRPFLLFQNPKRTRPDIDN